MMSCAVSELLLWSLRTWYPSSHSLYDLRRLEWRWLECDAQAAWPAVADFLTIVVLERARELHVEPPDGGMPTADEACLLCAFAVADWAGTLAESALISVLAPDSAAAAVRAAGRARRVLQSPARGPGDVHAGGGTGSATLLPSSTSAAVAGGCPHGLRRAVSAHP